MKIERIVSAINPATLILGAVALAAVYFWARGFKGAFGDIFEAVNTAAGELVMEVGTVLGIPKTDVARCVAHAEAGEWGSALLYCPAGTYVRLLSGAVIDPKTGETIGYTSAGKEEIVAPREYNPGDANPPDYDPDEVYTRN